MWSVTMSRLTLPNRKDNMSQKPDTKRPAENLVTIEEVNRVLEVGRLLLSVLYRRRD